MEDYLMNKPLYNVVPEGKKQNLSSQILQSRRIVFQDSPNSRTLFQIRTVAAGSDTLFHRTLTDATHTLTEYGLNSFSTTALTVDMFRKNRRMIQFSPQLCCFFPQFLVVIDCCEIRVAFFTIQPSASFQLIAVPGNHSLCHIR